MMTDNMRKFVEAVKSDADLKVKIEALEGAGDVIEQTIAIAADCGYTLAAEDFDGLTEEDFQESGDKSSALSIDDLEGARGGMKIEPIKSPKALSPILQVIFKIKREQQ